MVFLRKLKPIYPITSEDYNNCSAPPFKFYSKTGWPHPHFKKRAETAVYIRDYKGETIKLLPSCMTDFSFTKVITFEEN